MRDIRPDLVRLARALMTPVICRRRRLLIDKADLDDTSEVSPDSVTLSLFRCPLSSFSA
jgi:hypothetical protein